MVQEQFKAEYDTAFHDAVELVKKVNEMFINSYQGKLTDEQVQLIDEQEKALERFKEAEKNYFGD